MERKLHTLVTNLLQDNNDITQDQKNAFLKNAEKIDNVKEENINDFLKKNNEQILQLFEKLVICTTKDGIVTSDELSLLKEAGSVLKISEGAILHTIQSVIFRVNKIYIDQFASKLEKIAKSDGNFSIEEQKFIELIKEKLLRRDLDLAISLNQAIEIDIKPEEGFLLIAQIAMIDGILTKHESEMLHHFAHSLDISDEKFVLLINKAIHATQVKLIESFISELEKMASADGQFDDNEKKFISEIRKQLEKEYAVVVGTLGFQLQYQKEGMQFKDIKIFKSPKELFLILCRIAFIDGRLSIGTEGELLNSFATTKGISDKEASECFDQALKEMRARK